MESSNSEKIKSLLPLTYMPNVDWFAIYLNSDEVIIEAEENFSKQSYRNRCEILSANGPLPLILPVLNKNSKEGIQNMALNHSENWAWKHYHAIQSAYGKAAYFEYYQPEIEKLYNSASQDNLWSWNLRCLKMLLKWLKCEEKHGYTHIFEKENLLTKDFRQSFKPAKQTSIYDHKSYLQVFVDRFPFIQNLSVLDLVFNLGPQRKDYLLIYHYKNQLND